MLLTGPFGGLTDDVREFLRCLALTGWGELGRLLWHERDTLLQELAGLPPGQVDLAGFARRFGVLVSHRWPSMLAAADPAEWRQALWSTALAPLAMLGALDVPARMAPSPAWFALTAPPPPWSPPPPCPAPSLPIPSPRPPRTSR